MASNTTFSFLPDLPGCAANCLATAIQASACSSTDQTCICTSQPVLTSALGCYSLQCTVKQSLSSTNMTRAACGIPEESESSLTPGLAGGLGMLALIMVALRMIQRVSMKRSFGLDDGLILCALICAAPLNCLTFPLQKHGLGTNIWTIPFDDITEQLKLLLVAEIFYMPAEAFTQLSFLAFYVRIFPPSKYRYIAWILSLISICFGISNTFVMIFQCTPVNYFWHSWSGEYKGTCIDVNTFSWYRAAFQIAMDVSIIGLPLWPLSKLALSRRKKLLVMLMFCAGFLITVVSCLRLQSLIKFSKSPNVSMDNNPAIYWSIVECDVAIICACMPCLPALLKPLLPSCFGTTKHYDSGEAPLPPVRLERIKKEPDFSVLHSTASQDPLVQDPLVGHQKASE